MLDPLVFYKQLKKNNINFFTGVPDSLLKNFTKVFENKIHNEHLSVGNEGIAVSLAVGHYLSSGYPAFVYLQNSGLGNAINPLNSIANKKIYSIPMILMIGWRGEIKKKNKQIKDEPQHLYQGKITLKQLQLIDIPYIIISAKTKNIKKLINKIIKKSITEKKPIAIVVRKNTFKKTNNISQKLSKVKYPKRIQIIEEVIKTINKRSILVSTTGFTSRELYKLRSDRLENLSKDFLMVGGMGHASSIAAGIAKNIKNKKIICIDGDGSLLMHTASMQNSSIMKNFIHIMINNGVHDSVGGQKINSNKINYKFLSKGFGYSNYFKVKNIKTLKNILNKSKKLSKSTFIEVLSSSGTIKDIPRPKEKFVYRKNNFIKFLNN